MKRSPPTAQGIRDAYRQIDRLFRDTPYLNHPAADGALACRLFLKVETLNPTRAFKGRGTDWYVQNLAKGGPAMVAASAGNFGQGLAFAARKYGRSLTVFAATAANPLKIEAMRRLGAEVILEGHDFDAAKLAARQFAGNTGALLVEDGAEPQIAEGAGTMALEISEAGHRPDVILVPLGNGALITGIGTWMKQALPSCRVIGIVSELAPSMLLSWQNGRAMSTDKAPTVADGIAVREPVPYALECMVGTVDDVWSISEASILSAMRFCHMHYGLVAEPAGAAGIAAAMEHGARLKGQDVATVLCGSNLTPEQMKAYLA